MSLSLGIKDCECEKFRKSKFCLNDRRKLVWNYKKRFINNFTAETIPNSIVFALIILIFDLT